MKDDDLLQLIADHMEGGFLENIIDMFKHDRTLYRFLAELMADERGRVRLGTVALVESLRHRHLAEIDAQIPRVAETLLKHEEPTVRGDAVYLLGLIGGAEVLRHLYEAAHREQVEPIKQVIWETIEELSKGRP